MIDNNVLRCIRHTYKRIKFYKYTQLHKKVLQELISEADLDGDGNVNYEEFITMLFKVNITRNTEVQTDAIF